MREPQESEDDWPDELYLSATGAEPIHAWVWPKQRLSLSYVRPIYFDNTKTITIALGESDQAANNPDEHLGEIEVGFAETGQQTRPFLGGKGEGRHARYELTYETKKIRAWE